MQTTTKKLATKISTILAEKLQSMHPESPELHKAVLKSAEKLAKRIQKLNKKAAEKAKNKAASTPKTNKVASKSEVK